MIGHAGGGHSQELARELPHWHRRCALERSGSIHSCECNWQCQTQLKGIVADARRVAQMSSEQYAQFMQENNDRSLLPVKHVVVMPP